VPLLLKGAFDLLAPDTSFPKRSDVSAYIGKPSFDKGGTQRLEISSREQGNFHFLFAR